MFKNSDRGSVFSHAVIKGENALDCKHFYGRPEKRFTS
ncbi:hypothetical protein CHCC20375_4209 [Bacillus licheniformis]|nr:hypothetical protein CHCC20375_4209 [Bacillus licheniformis]